MNNPLTHLRLTSVILFALMMITSSAIAQPPANMTAGNYTLTGLLAAWYDSGGPGGTTCPGSSANNYSNNSNITETMTANAGQKIVVTWIGGTFGIASGDFLFVYDGP